MDKTVIFLFLIILTIQFITPASASALDNAGALMVQKGIELWSYSIGDSMIALGSGNSTVNQSQTPSLIMGALTYTVDPYKLSWVQSWWQTMFVFYILVAICALLGGAAMVIISKVFPDTASRMAWILGQTGETGTFNFRTWMSTVFLSLIFPFLTIFGVYFILIIQYVVSSLITTSVLTAVPPTTNNIIAYLFMTLTYLILTLIMALRNIIIILFAAGSLGIAALYLIPQLRELVKSIFVYFIIIVFMQPALIFIAAVGVIFLTNLPPALQPCSGVLYVALFLLLAVVGVVCIIGVSLVNRIVRAGTGI